MPINLNLPVSADGTLLSGKQTLLLGRLPFKRIDNGSELMNVNGLPAGAGDTIWDGDSSAWTRGGVGSVTTESAYSGTYGLDSGTVGANNESTFNNGSEIDVAGTYDVVSFWLQPKAYPGNAVLQVQWRNGVGAVIGNTLLVENYVTNMDLDVWQHVSIPIADFGLGADVQQFWINYKVGTQRHWIDDIHLEASGGGGPYTYRVSSPDGYVYHTEKMLIVISAADTGWSSNAFANISGGLQNGLLLTYRNINTQETFWTINSKNNAELFGHYEALNSVTFDNSEQLIVFSLNPDLSSVILVDNDDVLDITIRDDLSSLSNVRVFLHYGVEELPVDQS
jgi:hypothetical protein